MKLKTYIISVIAGVITSFVTAFIWHLTLFKDTYENLGVLGRMEPNLPLGFFATLFLAGVLPYLYPFFKKDGGPVMNGLRFGFWVAILNIIFWVLKFAATQPVSSVPMFISLESAFEFFQIGLLSILIAWIYDRNEN